MDFGHSLSRQNKPNQRQNKFCFIKLTQIISISLSTTYTQHWENKLIYGSYFDPYIQLLYFMEVFMLSTKYC